MVSSLFGFARRSSRRATSFGTHTHSVSHYQSLMPNMHRSGTVRSAGKGDYLKDIFKSHDDKFEYVIVKDIAEVCMRLCLCRYFVILTCANTLRTARSTKL